MNNPRKLLQLLAQNGQPKARARPRAQVEGDSANIYLNDVIDPYWGYSDAFLREDLQAAGGRPVALHINTPGGDVFEALAMAATLAGYKGTVTAHIAGLCASSGTRIASACAKVTMTDGSLYMVHNAWTLAMGNATELRATADLLDKVDVGIVADYARKTGKPAAACAEWMAAETWFTAQEAKDAGLVDEVVQAQNGAAPAGADPAAHAGGLGTVQASAQAISRWNLSAYRNVPAGFQASPPPRADLGDQFNARQAELYHCYEGIAEQFGPFDASTGAAGAHYMTGTGNPFAAQGIKCANCAMFEGPRACEVVAGDIDPEGACKLWIIPQALIAQAQPPAASGGLDVSALAEAHARLARSRLAALTIGA